MVTVSDPDVDVCDVQSAEQEVALEDDQVRVEVLSKRTEVGLTDKLIVGGGVVGPLSPPFTPPPPPPPQEAMNKTLNVMGSNFLINLIWFSLV